MGTTSGFAEDFVFLGQLGFELFDLCVAGTLLGLRFKGGCSVFEELLLPMIKHGWGDTIILADFGDRNVFEEVKAQNSDFFFWRILFSFLFGHSDYQDDRGTT